MKLKLHQTPGICFNFNYWQKITIFEADLPNNQGNYPRKYYNCQMGLAVLEV